MSFPKWPRFSQPPQSFFFVQIFLHLDISSQHKAIIPISDLSDLGRRPTTEDIPSEIGKNVRDWKIMKEKNASIIAFVFV